MKGIGEYLQFHASALQLRARRNEILASNIANAATPHFKARDLDFDGEIRRVGGLGNLDTSNVKHFASASHAASNPVKYRQPITSSVDGNTVELNVEQMEFSEKCRALPDHAGFFEPPHQWPVIRDQGGIDV